MPDGYGSSRPERSRDSRRPKRSQPGSGGSRRPGNKPASDPRLIAYDATRRISEADSFANLVLPKMLAASGTDSRGAAFATELVYGTQRWRGLLDAIIAAAAKRPCTAIDGRLLDALRIGAFQALFMAVADHAAVSQTVDLVRRRVGSHAAGFANAVMRRIAARSRQEWESIVVSRIPREQAGERLAIRFSHPAWVVDELTKAWLAAGYDGTAGFETSDDAVAAMLARDNEAPDVTLVARPGLTDRDELIASLPERARAENGRWSPYALRVHGVNPEHIDAVQEGRAGVEDEGSQLAALVLAEAPLGDIEAVEGPAQWLDMCAGPGGKTALLGALAARRGAQLTANEPSPHRAGLVRENVAALPEGTMREVSELDGRVIGSRTPQHYERILVDAPCSGLGSLRRRPEARWRKRPEDLTELAEVQRGLLASALDALLPGGVVAYVTCSPALAETRDIVDAVLDARDDAERIDAVEVLRGIDAGIPLPSRPGDVQLFEHLHDTDQMFISLIRRTR
ncbi:16S rRNA methyltransferase [Bifidobacterium primatium]|uniref:16S rRNA methyltransferase n=1 Tax=Bifidobacterium primatium TaxID=2045438 RepID=A0A2M9H7J6_9BIFI|nr:transcription antitermination factor NusB [Bifidobacterium primatium]PJM72782.1 16S rRNA methyltransferase [Bifidobacterium primatium]